MPARTLGVLLIPNKLSSGPMLKEIAKAIRRAAKAVRTCLIMMRFLSHTGERFDGITISERARRHITSTGYCTGYSSVSGKGMIGRVG
jgi:hypothetical protein